MLNKNKKQAILHTLSSNDNAAFNAPSGLPNGKQYLKIQTITNEQNFLLKI